MADADADALDPDRDPAAMLRAHFDALGAAEHTRLLQSPRTRVSLELHRRMLARFIRPGNRVLEVGAGSGRFTIELAALGATVTVSDISPVQLRINQTTVAEAGCEDAVEDRLRLDVRDLHHYRDACFDAVVAYGGPLSYAFERAEHALSECLRVTRPGGVVLASVMTTIGTLRAFLPTVVDDIGTFGAEVTDRVVHSGDLRHLPGDGHRCRMFRWREIEEMIGRLRCTLLAVSASNATSTGDPAALERLAADPDLWQHFLDWEEELAREPGALDGGTHTIFAVRRT
jgi:SAM-dependent methyltransferase